MFVLIRYYGLERLPKIISSNPPLIRLHSFLVCKVLLLLVTTFQDYYYFKPYLNIFKTHHQDNDFTSEIYSLYLYFNKKKLKPQLDSLYTTRASKNHAFCPHIFSILYSLRTISGVKLQLQWPCTCGTTCARKLSYTGFTIVQLDIQFFTISFERREVLNGRSWRSKIKNTFFFLSIFLKFFISFIYLCISIDIYTPSNQHFKAFLVSKFNSRKIHPNDDRLHTIKHCGRLIHDRKMQNILRARFQSTVSLSNVLETHNATSKWNA